MQTTDDILFSAHGPDPIPTATTEIVGTPGNTLNVYWIVSHFPIGSVVSGPFPQKSAPNVLDDENYVHISWLPTLGALTYDLLFTDELELPKQPGRFLLAANLTQTEFRDTGQDLDLYDLAGIRYGAPQQEWIFFDNRDRKQPTLRFIPWPIEVSSIIFEDGSSLSTAGAAGGAAPPDQSVQFNNNSAFGGSPNLLWDGNNLLVGPPNVQNFPTPGPSDRILSVQGSAGPGTVEVSNGAGDAPGLILGNFLWIDKNRIAPSNDAGVIRILTTGLTPNNRGTRMEFFTRIDGSIATPLPGPHMVIDQGLVGINMLNPQWFLDVGGLIAGDVVSAGRPTSNAIGPQGTPFPLQVTGLHNQVFYLNVPTGNCQIFMNSSDSVGTNEIAFNILGNRVGSISTYPLGTVSIYSSQSDLSISVQPNGNVAIPNLVGIGTLNPQATLDIAGTSGSTIVRLNASNLGFNNSIQFYSGGGLVGLIIDYPPGTLGITAYYGGESGSTSISANGDFKVSSSSSIASLSLFTNSSAYASAAIRVGNDGSVDNGVMTFSTATANVLGERMRIDSQGRVDITGSLFINGIQVIP